MIEVIGIKMKSSENILYYNPQKMQFEKGEKCVIETVTGSEEAEVVLPNFFLEPDKILAPLRMVLRYLTDRKEVFAQKKDKMEKRAWEYCAKRIDDRKLLMRLVDVKYTDDLRKVIFYFVAENRVDFRELLKDLVKTFRIKIELRQISRREYAKKIGGMGICGRECCCKSYLKAFTPITIRMAKMQGLPLNPSKISGVCGRLLCCLAYEKYEQAVQPILAIPADDDAGIENILDEPVSESQIETELDVNWADDN